MSILTRKIYVLDVFKYIMDFVVEKEKEVRTVNVLADYNEHKSSR